MLVAVIIGRLTGINRAFVGGIHLTTYSRMGDQFLNGLDLRLAFRINVSQADQFVISNAYAKRGACVIRRIQMVLKGVTEIRAAREGPNGDAILLVNGDTRVLLRRLRGFKGQRFGDAFHRLHSFIKARKKNGGALKEFAYDDVLPDVTIDRRRGREFDLTLYGRVVRCLQDATGDGPDFLVAAYAVGRVGCQVALTTNFVADQDMGHRATIRSRQEAVMPRTACHSVKCLVRFVRVNAIAASSGCVNRNDRVPGRMGVTQIRRSRSVRGGKMSVGFQLR